MSNSIVIKEPKPAIEEKSATQKQNADIVSLVKTQNDIIAQNNKMMTALVEASKENAIQQEKKSKINDLQRQLSEARLQKRVESLNNRTKKSEEEKTSGSTYNKVSGGVDGVMGKGFTSSMLMSALTMGAINPVVAKSLNLPQLAGGAIKAGTNVFKKTFGFPSSDSNESSGTTSNNDEATKDSKILKKIDTIINLLGKDSEGGSAEPKTKKGIFSKIFEVLGAGLGLFGDTLTGLIKTGLLVAGATFVYDLIKDKLKSIAEWIFGEEAVNTLITKFKTEGLWGTITFTTEILWKKIGDLIFGEEGSNEIANVIKNQGLWTGLIIANCELIKKVYGLIFGDEAEAKLNEVLGKDGFWGAAKLITSELFTLVTDSLFGKGAADVIQKKIDDEGFFSVMKDGLQTAINKIGTLLFGTSWENAITAETGKKGFWSKFTDFLKPLMEKLGIFLIGPKAWEKMKAKCNKDGIYTTIVTEIGNLAVKIGEFMFGKGSIDPIKNAVTSLTDSISNFVEKLVYGIMRPLDNISNTWETSEKLGLSLPEKLIAVGKSAFSDKPLTPNDLIEKHVLDGDIAKHLDTFENEWVKDDKNAETNKNFLNAAVYQYEHGDINERMKFIKDTEKMRDGMHKQARLAAIAMTTQKERFNLTTKTEKMREIKTDPLVDNAPVLVTTTAPIEQSRDQSDPSTPVIEAYAEENAKNMVCTNKNTEAMKNLTDAITGWNNEMMVDSYIKRGESYAGGLQNRIAPMATVRSGSL